MRLGTVSTGPDFPKMGSEATPLLLYSALTGMYPPRYDAGWSNWYSRYPRRPDLNHLVAPYVAGQLVQVPGIGSIGWLDEGDNTRNSADGTPTPPWALGPAHAVDVEKNMRASAGWKPGRHAR